MKYHQPFDQPGNPDASYVNANPSLGIKGSILDGVAVEQVQREIIKVITEAGLSPADGDLTQLWQAIQSLAGTITNTAITNYLTGGSVDVNIPYAVAGGTADAITAVFSPALPSLTDGKLVLLKIGAASNATTGPTVNGTIVIGNDGSSLAVGALPALGFTLLGYDLAHTSWKFIAGFALGGSGGSFIPGVPYPWLTETPPVGTLECNGAAVSRTTYSRLYGILGTRFGPGDGSNTFNLPDFRSEIMRGWDHGRGVDPDRAIRTDRGDGTAGDHVGTKQDGAVGPISITGGTITIGNPKVSGTDYIEGAKDYPMGFGRLGTTTPGGDYGGADWNTANVGNAAALTGSASIAGNSGASETRMRNIAVMYVIGY